MTHELSDLSFHPAGEQPPVEGKGSPQGVILDSYAGPVHVEWDTEAALTPLGQLPFFIDFLKAAGLFDAFVADCPLRYTSLFYSTNQKSSVAIGKPIPRPDRFLCRIGF
jgi:hypothetical protein